jgi:hypothetical protein
MPRGWNTMTDNEKEILEKFAARHHVSILDSNKRISRLRRMMPRYFTDGVDYNYVDQHVVQHDTETLYTVTIPESELNRIAELEQRMFNRMIKDGSYNLFEIMIGQKEREKYLVEKYPAIKKAYEQYSMLLKLAESGELDA